MVSGFLLAPRLTEIGLSNTLVGDTVINYYYKAKLQKDIREAMKERGIGQ